MADTAKLDLEKLATLRSLLLDDFMELAKSGDLTPTDRRTLAGLLKDNNMQLDPLTLPQSLRDRLSDLPKDSGIEEDARDI